MLVPYSQLDNPIKRYSVPDKFSKKYARIILLPMETER